MSFQQLFVVWGVGFGSDPLNTSPPNRALLELGGKSAFLIIP